MRCRAAIVAIGMLLNSFPVHATSVHKWSKMFTGSGVDAGFAVESDGAGNVVLAGIFQHSVDFGGGYLIGFPSTVVAKYDANGAHLWSRSYSANCADMTLDGSGNVIVTGTGSGTIDFGGGPMPGGSAESYISKYDANGSFLWARRFNSVGGSGISRAVTADASGNIFITGGFVGTLSLGGVPLTSAGGNDIFIAKYDATGTHLWSVRFGTALFHDNGMEIDDAGAGSVVVTGGFGDTVNFGGAPLVSAGGIDIFLAKFDGAGLHQWSMSAGGPIDETGEAVATDAAGNVVTTGSFTDTINFGGANLISAGGGDVYLAKHDANGVHQWSVRHGGTSNDRGLGIDVDAFGSIALSGRFRGTASFGGASFTSAGEIDLFVARYDATGVHEWSQAFGSNATLPPPNGSNISDVGYAVCIDGSGNTFATGVFAGTVDFGGGPLVGVGMEEIFLIKYGESPLPVLINNFSATARGGVVDVRWDLSADEALDAFTLRRTTKDDTRSVVVATGDASTRAFTDESVEAGKAYEYALTITTAGGDLFHSPVATVELPRLASSLEQNHPNPFNPSTTITFTLSERASTAVRIYDAAGALVVRLDAGEHDAGTHVVTWNGRDASGRSVASGVYFYQLEGVTGLGARKMVLLK